MKRSTKNLLTLFATAALFFGCEKDEDIGLSTTNNMHYEECDVITFESAPMGVYINSVMSQGGWGPIAVYNRANNSEGQLTDPNRARIFDTENWTGDDDDLIADWGKVLIIQELGVENEPNDNRWGGEMRLTFPEPVTLKSMRVLDIDTYENESYVYLLDAGGNQLYSVQLQPLGDNSKQTVDLGNTQNVKTMVIDLNGEDGNVGSGAIDNIEFCWRKPHYEEKGCTRTQGYWKTHSGMTKNEDNKGKGKGQNKYDATWDDYLNETLSRLGDDTYPEILWTAPKGGDADIILAHQFIAAELNVAAGASIPPKVLDAWLAAQAYLEGDTEASRHQVLAWAEILDKYNNGIYGPGHCD